MAKFSVRSLEPDVSDPGWVNVRVHVDAENNTVGWFEVRFQVPATDPNQAIELARTQMVKLGEVMAAAASSPGSLRLIW